VRRDQQVGLGGGQDGGRVDQPLQVDGGVEQPVTVINDARESAERHERAAAQQ